MLPTAQSKPKEQGGSGLTGAVKLLVCIVGLQVSYLTWGVLQVQAHTDAQTHYRCPQYHTKCTFHI